MSISIPGRSVADAEAPVYFPRVNVAAVLGTMIGPGVIYCCNDLFEVDSKLSYLGVQGFYKSWGQRAATRSLSPNKNLGRQSLVRNDFKSGEREKNGKH